MSTWITALTDEQLMAGCRGADPDQARTHVGELARRHLTRVTGFVLGLLGDATAAQDLAQEAFVRIYRHRDQYEDVGRFTTWMYTIARNLALNEIRNRRNRPALVLDAPSGGAHGSGEHAAVASVASRGEAPPDAAEKGDLRARVQRAVAQLEEHHRSVVVLCDLEQRPYAEAAQVLGVPVGTIRSRLSRAREQLARLLEGVE